MYQSPRIRRLHNDLAALERLKADSTVFRFTASGDPPQHYSLVLKGKSLWRERGRVKLLDQHRVEIKLGASYPRSIPEIRWLTPIFHPNISEIGMVCLGGYGTHWVPSVQLDDLCVMLWDMARYHNYDVRSPYNREAALWVASQAAFRFPTDDRPLRDLRAASGRANSSGDHATKSATTGHGDSNGARRSSSSFSAGGAASVLRVLRFIERYGRGSDDASPPRADRGGLTEHLARLSPAVPTRDPSNEPSPAAPRNNDSQTAEHDHLALEYAGPSSDPQSGPATSAPAGHTSLNGLENEVMILGPSSDADEARLAASRPADDDVMYIG